MVPSLQRSAMRSSASQSSQNKTYVRLSMKQPQDQITSIPTATAGAFSCYQTLIDINNSKYHTHETGKNIFIYSLYCHIHHVNNDGFKAFLKEDWWFISLYGSN